jgi:hypothetical protein
MLGDTIYRSVRADTPPMVFFPLSQWPDLHSRLRFYISARSGGAPPSRLVKSIGARLRSVDPKLILSFHTLDDELDGLLAQDKIVALLSCVFGAIGVVLAALGLYGVTALLVVRRRHEIAIRMALGAKRVDAIRLVVSRVFVLTLAGASMGIVLSVWAIKLLRSLTYGIDSQNWQNLTMATAFMCAVAVVAGWVPAARATLTEPAEVLRNS